MSASELLTADLRVNAPQERLVLEVQPRLEALAVKLAGVRLIMQKE